MICALLAAFSSWTSLTIALNSGSFRKLSNGGYISAICAAPIVLGHIALLDGKKATCYPGFDDQLGNAVYTGEPVTVDNKIITGKGPGCAIPFALKLVEIIKNKELSDQLKNGMQVYWM